ncbi:ABC transporter ATP-binding protein, partial [Streptococcus danieliae]|nr:ABC transporter ATP-binding protein [Streptococcus danieliae]
TASLISAVPEPDPEFERNRKQKEYDASIEDDKKGKPRKLHEITPGHYVRCSEDEIAMY